MTTARHSKAPKGKMQHAGTACWVGAKNFACDLHQWPSVAGILVFILPIKPETEKSMKAVCLCYATWPLRFKHSGKEKESKNQALSTFLAQQTALAQVLHSFLHWSQLLSNTIYRNTAKAMNMLMPFVPAMSSPRFSLQETVQQGICCRIQYSDQKRRRNDLNVQYSQNGLENPRTFKPYNIRQSFWVTFKDQEETKQGICDKIYEE